LKLLFSVLADLGRYNEQALERRRDPLHPINLGTLDFWKKPQYYPPKR